MIYEFLVLAIVIIFVLWAVKQLIPNYERVAAVLCGLLLVLWIVRFLLAVRP